MGGVGADVSTLVIRVDGEVQPHQFHEVGVFTEAELVCQVETVILVLLDGGDLAVFVNVAVDACSNGWEFGDKVHGVLEGVLPVLGLLHALGIGLCERGFVLESVYGNAQLGHWVKVTRAAVNELFDELGHIGAGSPFGGQVTDLLL